VCIVDDVDVDVRLHDFRVSVCCIALSSRCFSITCPLLASSGAPLPLAPTYGKKKLNNQTMSIQPAPAHQTASTLLLFVIIRIVCIVVEPCLKCVES